MWICPDCRTIYTERAESCERDQAPLAEVQAHQTRSRYPLLGRVVGERYHLIGGLGQGGLGTVYLAQHRHLGQLFAVKFLDLESLIDQDKRQKEETRHDFLKEARVASLIRHDAVVRVSDFGEYDGLPFLVMEYVPGPSLLHVLSQRGRFREDEAISIVRRIAEALDAFHERRLVHRDLKPANVILDPRGDGRLTLVDLGLVKDLSGPGGRASTHPLALRGTPGYLAPEQVPAWVLSGAGVMAEQDKQLVDARVDIYALGVIFYEMLAGVSPYPEGSNTQIIVYCCTRDPIPFTEVHPPLRLRPGLAELVYTTMHRDPSSRPASAAEFLERLDAVAMGVTASRTSWPALVLPRSSRLHDSLGVVVPPSALSRSLLGSPPVEDGETPSVDLEATHVFDASQPGYEQTVEAPADSLDVLLDASAPLEDALPEDVLDASLTAQMDDLPLDMLDTLVPAPEEPPTRVDGYNQRLAEELAPQVEAALRPSVRGRPEPEPPPPPLQVGSPRSKAPLLLLAVLLVAIVGLGLWTLVLRDRPDAPVITAPAEVTVASAVPLEPDAEAVQAVPAPPADAAVPQSTAPVTAADPPDAAPPTAARRPPRRARPKPRPKPKPSEVEAPPDRTLERLLNQGRNAAKQRRYQDAAAIYRDFLERAPKDHPEYQVVRNRVKTLEKLPPR